MSSSDQRKHQDSVWALILTGVAGDVDGIALSATSWAASHMSGTTSLYAHDLDAAAWILATGAFGLVIAFVAGAVATGMILGDPAVSPSRRRLSAALTLEAASLLLAGFGSCLSPGGPVLMLALAAFAMGGQNAFSTLCLGDRTRTTHVTGTLTDLGAAAGRMMAIRSGVPNDTSDRDMLGQSAARVGAFVIGGLLGGLTYRLIGTLSLVVPATVVFATAQSCRRDRRGG